MPRVFDAKKSTRGKEIHCRKCSAKIEPSQNYFYFFLKTGPRSEDAASEIEGETLEELEEKAKSEAEGEDEGETENANAEKMEELRSRAQDALGEFSL